MNFKTLDRSLRFGMWVLVAFLSGLLAAPCGAREPVERKAPAIYAENLAQLLTPAADLVKLAPIEQAPADRDDQPIAVTCLLEESVRYVSDDGRRFEVQHLIMRAHSKEGARALAESTAEFARDTQAIYLPLARTLQADGSEAAVRDNAAFISSSQWGGDVSLYDDLAELKVIFPDVREDSMTETIIVIETTKPHAPDEFSLSDGWASYQHLRRKRKIVDLPAALASRLKLKSVGKGVPEPQRSENGEGRVRWIWSKEELEPMDYESGRPPLTQTGPWLAATTWDSWNAVASWYSGLLQGRGKLDEAHAAEVTAWTEGIEQRGEIVRLLLRKVSVDVRYTGLEFGIARVRPYDCNQVWKNRYGDCKDKANLLRAQLAHCGITSHIVLINSGYSSDIDQEIPDFRHFNHAILAVDDGDGGYLFCDPTDPHAVVGMLPEHDCDRLVLIVKGDQADVRKAPPHDPGSSRYQLDLEMEPDGKLSGWIDVEGKGFRAAYLRNVLDEEKSEDQRTAAAGVIRFIHYGMTVADVQVPEKQPQGDTFRFRCYIDISSSTPATLERELPFPGRATGLPYLGGYDGTEEGEVPKWPTDRRRHDAEISGSIKFPSGWLPPSVPDPISVDSHGIRADFDWGIDRAKGLCNVAARVKVEAGEITPVEFPGASAAVKSVRDWATPLKLVPVDQAALVDPERGRLRNFPRLSGGDGQMALVESRYPIDGNLALRRKAFEKVLVWFPDERRTVFMAQIWLANIDQTEGLAAKGAERLKGVIQAARRDLSKEEFALAEFLLGTCLGEDESTAGAAIGILKRLAADDKLEPFRRAHAGYAAAELMYKRGDHEAAAACATQNLDNDSVVNYGLSLVLAKSLAASGGVARLAPILERIRSDEQSAHHFRGTFEAMVVATGQLEGEPRTALLAVLDSIEVEEDSGEWKRSLLAQAKAGGSGVVISKQIKQSVVEYIEANRDKLSFLKKPIAAHLRTREQFRSACADAERQADPATGINLATAALLRFNPDAEYSTDLWNAQRYALWFTENAGGRSGSRGFLEFLLDQSDRYAEGHAAWQEGRFLRAHGHRIFGEHQKERETLQALSTSDGFEPSPALWHRLGVACENCGDPDAALESYKKLETADAAGETCDGLARATYLRLERGESGEAIRLIKLLAQFGNYTLQQATFRPLIEELVQLENEGHAETYWKSMEVWWPKWLALEKAIGLDPQRRTGLVPHEAAALSLGAQLGQRAQAGVKPLFEFIRPLAYGARWNPSQLANFSGAVTFAASSATAQTAALRELIIEASSAFPLKDSPHWAAAKLNVAAHAIDARDFERSRAAVAEYFARDDQADDDTKLVLAALGVMIAELTKEGETEAVERYVELAGRIKSANRGHIPNTARAARLLMKLGRNGECVAFLEKQLGDGNNADPGSEALRELLETARGADGEAEKFNQFVAAWMRKLKPEWYEYARVEDAEQDDIPQTGPFNPTSASQISAIKKYLEIAQDREQAIDERRSNFIFGASGLLRFAGDEEQFRKQVDTLLPAEVFSEYQRFIFLSDAFEQAAKRFPHLVSGYLKELPFLKERRSEGLRKSLDQLISRFVMLVEMSHAAPPLRIAKLEEIIAQEELERLDSVLFFEGVSLLYLIGEVEAADALIAKATSHKDFADIKSRMRLKRVPQDGRKEAPALAALREFTRESVIGKQPGVSEPQNDRLAEIRIPHASRTPQESRQLAVDFLMGGKVPTNVVLGLLLDAFDDRREPLHDEWGRRWYSIALEQTSDEAGRAEIISLSRRKFDADDAGTREFLKASWVPYRDPRKHPECHREIRLAEAMYAARSGEPLDWSAALKGLEGGGIAERMLVGQLEQALLRGEDARLRTILEGAEVELLTSPGVLPIATRAYEKLGLEGEAELFRDEIRKKMRESVLSGWAVPEIRFGSGMIFFEYLQAVPDGIDLLPERFRDLLFNDPNPSNALLFRALHATAKEDWPEAERAADGFIKLCPTHYDGHWLSGNAAAKLGHKKKAISALEIYTKFARDTLEYPEAVKWLEELRAPDAVTPSAR